MVEGLNCSHHVLGVVENDFSNCFLFCASKLARWGICGSGLCGWAKLEFILYGNGGGIGFCCLR